MKWDMNKLSKWAKNTKHHHQLRGLPLNIPRREIIHEAQRIITEEEGRCPRCGRKMNQIHLHPGQLTLDYIDSTTFQIVCNSCNNFLGSHEGRINENSK